MFQFTTVVQHLSAGDLLPERDSGSEQVKQVMFQFTTGVKHLSAGDLLRAERDSGSEHGAMINEYMKEGRIIPVKVFFFQKKFNLFLCTCNEPMK